jgi:hypothetical protein
MQTYDPLQARQWFKLRAPVNWAITIVVFIPLVFLLQNMLPVFIADVIAIALVFCLFFFFLHKRAIAIECPHCGKYIQTNTPWVCGVCGVKNLRVDDFPFVNRCENKECGCEPKAYKCHYLDCGELIFLSHDKSEINYAQCVNMPEKSRPVTKSKSQNKVADLHEAIQVGELQVKKAKIDAELKGITAELEPPKRKTAFEELEEYYKGMMGNEDAAKKWKAAIDEEFKTNDDERKKRHLVVDQWMTNRL